MRRIVPMHHWTAVLPPFLAHLKLGPTNGEHTWCRAGHPTTFNRIMIPWLVVGEHAGASTAYNYHGLCGAIDKQLSLRCENLGSGMSLSVENRAMWKTSLMIHRAKPRSSAQMRTRTSTQSSKGLRRPRQVVEHQGARAATKLLPSVVHVVAAVDDMVGPLKLTATQVVIIHTIMQVLMHPHRGHHRVMTVLAVVSAYQTLSLTQQQSTKVSTRCMPHMFHDRARPMTNVLHDEISVDTKPLLRVCSVH